MQGVLANQIRSESRKIAFWQRLKLPEQEIGNDTVEHSIPEKLEALVVWGTETAVC